MIRPATHSDIPAMLELLHQLFTIEVDFNFSVERQERGLELLLATPSATIMVVEDHGKAVGMATGQLVISTAEGGLSLLVEDLVVVPTSQNQGIGAALLAALAEWGVDRGASRMQLLADRTNEPALFFYHRQGWQETQLICLRKYSNRETTQ
jgi:ribosomal protein S18 acetylase RimI-like enzyme